jgi:hypothetical protein
MMPDGAPTNATPKRPAKKKRLRRPGWAFAVFAFVMFGIMAPGVLHELKVLDLDDIRITFVILISAFLVMVVGYWLTQSIPVDDREE